MKSLFLVLLIMSCTNQVKKKNKVTLNTDYHSRVIRNINHSFAYLIFEDSVMRIKQLVVPAKSGNTGFKDSISAKRTADLVIHKLNSGMFPPTLTEQEIDSLLKIP